jgi:hypothetical protein
VDDANSKTRLSRRRVLRSGLASGAAALVSGRARSSWAQTGGPPTTPFVEELPVPASAEPVDGARYGVRAVPGTPCHAAANPAQGLHASFSPGGLELRGDDWRSV